MLPTRDKSPKYTKRSCSLVWKKQTTQWKSGQNTWTDISPKMKYRWLKHTYIAQHCSVLEKCKSVWGITSYQSEWSSSKNLQTMNTGDGVEKKEPTFTVGRKVDWYSHYGGQYGDFFKNLEINYHMTQYPKVHLNTICNSYYLEAT